MEEIYLPVLSHFENGNGWTGSGGRLRYQITPVEGHLSAEIWEGPWCYECSRPEERQDFPLSEEGLTQVAGWLGDWLVKMAMRPARTPEETLRRYVLADKEAN